MCFGEIHTALDFCSHFPRLYPDLGEKWYKRAAHITMGHLWLSWKWRR